jgi:hypothetical protein
VESGIDSPVPTAMYRQPSAGPKRLPWKIVQDTHYPAHGYLEEQFDTLQQAAAIKLNPAGGGTVHSCSVVLHLPPRHRPRLAIAIPSAFGIHGGNADAWRSCPLEGQRSRQALHLLFFACSSQLSSKAQVPHHRAAVHIYQTSAPGPELSIIPGYVNLWPEGHITIKFS